MDQSKKTSKYEESGRPVEKRSSRSWKSLASQVKTVEKIKNSSGSGRQKDQDTQDSYRKGSKDRSAGARLGGELDYVSQMLCLIEGYDQLTYLQRSPR